MSIRSKFRTLFGFVKVLYIIIRSWWKTRDMRKQARELADEMVKCDDCHELDFCDEHEEKLKEGVLTCGKPVLGGTCDRDLGHDGPCWRDEDGDERRFGQ